MIASSDRTTQVALYNYALRGYEDKTGNLHPRSECDRPGAGQPRGRPPGDTPATVPLEAVIKRDSVNHKTTYEIKLPKAALGLTT